MLRAQDNHSRPTSPLGVEGERVGEVGVLDRLGSPRSNRSPPPQPNASTRSFSSWLARGLSAEALTTLRIFLRGGTPRGVSASQRPTPHVRSEELCVRAKEGGGRYQFVPQQDVQIPVDGDRTADQADPTRSHAGDDLQRFSRGEAHYEHVGMQRDASPRFEDGYREVAQIPGHSHARMRADRRRYHMPVIWIRQQNVGYQRLLAV
jgi:hypothetical protein